MSESPNEQPRRHILKSKSEKTMQRRGSLEKGNFLLSLIFYLMLMKMAKFHARESGKKLTLLCLRSAEGYLFGTTSVNRLLCK